jgi:2-C-methyl-D-erythritol 2,4-cyclodiphosphate synthase
VVAPVTVRVGVGLDAHPFADGRRLMLGCVEVPHQRGLAGHSDGDVVAHAVCDAILGAAGLGDLGERFPADAHYEGAAGAVLLAETADAVAPAAVVWVDVTVICEAPRIAPHREAMRKGIAAALGVDAGCVSVKATTTDGMGFTGRGEGIAAIAAATLDDGRA